MKQKSIFICGECGATSTRWLGKCPTCGAWDSYSEHLEEPKKKIKMVEKKFNKIVRLDEIDTGSEFRISTGITELDRVLGGGIVPGSIVLVGGDPGIGKSTLMLQMCKALSDCNPLYVTGEESLRQIKYRSMRLKSIPDDLMLLAETNIEIINSEINASKSDVVIIDSIQSVYSERIDSTPGSIVQVRECASLLMQTAKLTGKAIFLIGHVTKEGFIAGPKILEHMVDTVLQFEGEKTYSYRILRALKNRFGSTNELGIFEMGEDGLQEVINPSELFLSHRLNNESGIAIVAAVEGTRPILLEVQALASLTGYGVPQRTANGFDIRRLQMILAVLEKRLGLMFKQYDVFINIAGGVYLNDTAVDLGLAAALVSSFRDTPLRPNTAIIGEIGLTGEVRHVPSIEQRASEARKLGFERLIAPKTSISRLKNFNGMELIPVDRISLALGELL